MCLRFFFNSIIQFCCLSPLPLLSLAEAAAFSATRFADTGTIKPRIVHYSFSAQGICSCINQYGSLQWEKGRLFNKFKVYEF